MTYHARDEVAFANGSAAQRVAPVTTSGTPINPAREDGRLADLAGAMAYACTGEHRLAIDGTSRTLAAMTDTRTGAPLGAAAIPDDLVRISLVREDGSGGQIHFQHNAAAAAGGASPTPQWESAGASVPITAVRARLLQFISASGTIYATLRIFTPR